LRFTFATFLTTCVLAGANIGIEVAARPSPFIDLAKEARRFTNLSGTAPAPLDAQGWPTTDGQVVVFDERPFGAWAPPVDDPASFQPDMSGVYRISFTGQAIVNIVAPAAASISGQIYDAAANRTALQVNLPRSAPALLILRFRETRRNPKSLKGSGITGLRCIRPGYAPDTQEVFDRAFLDALRPFAYLRFMVWLGTNDSNRGILEWRDRSLPSDATQHFGGAQRPGAIGISWEYVIAIANAVHKDVWINIPAPATGEDPRDTASYVYQLASLLKRDLNPDLAVYLEYSNELWYSRFEQGRWNRDAAAAEVARGKSHLNNDGVRDPEVWARRRSAQRLYQIANIFSAVFGGSQRIRPVYAWWCQRPEEFRDVLTWMNKTYGAPRNYFWGIAQSDYFYDASAPASATVPQILAAMRASSDSGVTYTRRIDAVARQFGLQHTCYEGGPDNHSDDASNVANRILANRTEEMASLIERHVLRNWFPYGPVSFTYFQLSSGYARYGAWGATEDYRDTSSPKFRALLRLASPNSARR
jgi:hypothetical protein